MKQCAVCGKDRGLHHHEVFYGSNRQISIKYGFQEWLCGFHHNLSDQGVHFDRELDLMFKRKHQEIFEQSHSRAEWMKLIGRNYL